MGDGARVAAAAIPGRQRTGVGPVSDPSSPDSVPTAAAAEFALRSTGWRVWVSGYLLIFGMLAAWSLATPGYAAPDEPAHAFRAASLVRGELFGADVSKPGDPSLLVRVPTALTANSPVCFAFRSWRSASCMTARPVPPGTAEVKTYTGRYPPLYYLVVGLPSLLPLGNSMLIWMRLAGDLINALFLTVAFIMLTRRRRCWWAVAGGAVAVTPMVLFIGSVINPSGLEIASAMAFWCALLHWATAPTKVPDRLTLTWATVSAVVFESVRGLSTVFLLGTVVACALVAGLPRIRTAVRRHDVRVAGAVVGVTGGVAVVWVVLAGSLRLLRTAPVPASRSTSALIDQVLYRSTRFPGFVGKFGWLDTAPPEWVVNLWLVAVVGLFVGVVVSRAWRSLAALVLVVAGTIVIPAVGDLLEARTIGVVSQARYILPIAVGTVLVAGSAIRWRGPRSRTVVQLMLSGLAAAQIGAFVRALQRYRTGVGPAVDRLRPQWSPPLGTIALTAIFAAAVVGFLVWSWRAGYRDDRADVSGRALVTAGAGQLE